MIPLTGGDDPRIGGPSLAVGQMGDAGSVCDFSPLQDFVRAKEKINGIFMELKNYVCDALTYVQSVQLDGSIVNSDDSVKVKHYIKGVKDIQNILTRDHMKVALFGRTSNGKSSVINAMLGKKILPSNCGHTTNCFVQLEGSDIGEPYLVIEGSTERQNVEAVKKLANSLCKESLGESQLLHIYWPKDQCHLLRDGFVFVDCPGTGMSSNLDKWINRYCQDADVFMYVANAVSTLMDVEKEFLIRMSKKLSKPNIFILNNYWDVVASDSDSPDEVRAQHMELEVKFLVEELKVCTQEEANQRIFFVSAKEALQARLPDLPADNKNNQASGALADGFPDRYFETQLRKFEECLSKSAVRTKFVQHSQSGKLIVSEIGQIFNSMYARAQQLKTQKAVEKKEINEKLKCTKQQLSLLEEEMKGKIQQMVKDVEQMVSKALSEEINCLSVLVDEFNSPFQPEHSDLNEYKKKLHHHVENGLGSKLHERFSTEHAMKIENIQREMTERMSGLLPAKKKQVSLNALPQREPFKISYSLNCDNLCADFHEDLSFRFSGRPKGRVAAAALGTAAAGAGAGTAAAGAGAGTAAAVAAAAVPVAVTVTAEAAFAGFILGPVGIGAGAVVAAVGAVPVAAITATLGVSYSVGNYLYKHFIFTNKAKEIEFKRQFVAHVTNKQQVIVDSTSANCSKQAEQVLSSTLIQLCDRVNKAINDMDAKIKTLDKEIKQLEEAANSAKVRQIKANDITKQLEEFDDAFLKPHN